jgi:hypothetical protein
MRPLALSPAIHVPGLGLALATFVAAACGVTVGEQSTRDAGPGRVAADGEHGGGDASSPGASVGGAAGGGDEATCAGGTMPLVVTTQSTPLGMAPSKLFVPATYRADAVLFELDTGSPETFVHEQLQDSGTNSDADITPDAGSVELGCDTVTLRGIGVSPTPPVGGKTVAGTLGSDRLLARSFALDFVASRIVWNEPGAPFPDAASWPSAPFDRPFGYVRIHDVAFDGKPVQLVVDTGSPDSLWLGEQGQPGDTEVDGVDADGDVLKMYLGTVEVTMGQYKTKVPVYRVPKFPYLQHLVDGLGGHLNGLFGLSALRKGVVIDTDAQLVRVAP